MKKGILLVFGILFFVATGYAQQSKFSFLQGTTEKIIDAHFDRDSAQLITLDLAGYVITWDVNTMLPLRKFLAVPTFILGNDYYKVPRKYLKVEKNKIWVYDNTLGLSKPQLDVYNRFTGAYVYPDESDFKSNYKAFYKEPLEEFKNLNKLKKEQPFGKYRITYNSDSINIYSVENGKKLKLVERGNNDLFIRDFDKVFFITEDVLIICGTVLQSEEEDVATMGQVGNKSLIYKYNWKTNVNTKNKSYDKEFDVLSKAELVSRDSVMFFKSKDNLWLHQIKPDELRHSFFSEKSNTDHDFFNQVEHVEPIKFFEREEEQMPARIGFLIDDNPSTSVYTVQPYTVADMALIEHKYDGSYGDVLYYKHLKGGNIPIRFHSGQKLMLWRSKYNKYVLTDFSANVLLNINGPIIYEHLLSFSPKGDFLTLMESADKIELIDLKSLKSITTINTGFDPKIAYMGKIQLKSDQTKLAYNAVFDNVPMILIADLKNKKVDTALKNVAGFTDWKLNKSFDKLAFYYPIKIYDTLFFSKNENIELAKKYALRNIFNPSIIIKPLKSDKFEGFSTGLPINKLDFFGDKIVALDLNGMLNYYDLNSNNTSLKHWLYGNEEAIFSNSSYYATPKLISNLLVKNKNKYEPIVAEDILYNVPHQVLKELGSTKTELINLYKLAYEKRLGQYTKNILGKLGEQAPEINLNKADWNDLSLKDSILNLNLNLKSKDINKILVKVNGYAVYGRNGLNLANNNINYVPLKIPLDSGRNEVIIQAVDKNGNYSSPIKMDYLAKYALSKNQQKKLWILAAGVSNYKDRNFNLKYAAKDAGDFARIFNYKMGYKPEIILLKNEEVNASKILERIKQAKVSKNDLVIIYLAGHGLLDKTGNFYYAAQDIDFNKPEKLGLSYNNLIAQLEQLPNKRKIVFLDACNSGYVDRTALKLTNEIILKKNHLQQQNTRGITLNNELPLNKNTFLFMRKLFSDFSSDNNINIISAALGNSYALENSKLQNGLFTYAIIKGLGLGEATKSTYNMDRKYAEGTYINIEELCGYIENQVKVLSNGSQTPTFNLSKSAKQILFYEDRFNLEMNDFGVYKTDSSEKTEGEKYKQFLDRYKKQ